MSDLLSLATPCVQYEDQLQVLQEVITDWTKCPDGPDVSVRLWRPTGSLEVARAKILSRRGRVRTYFIFVFSFTQTEFLDPKFLDLFGGLSRLLDF